MPEKTLRFGDLPCLQSAEVSQEIGDLPISILRPKYLDQHLQGFGLRLEQTIPRILLDKMVGRRNAPAMYQSAFHIAAHHHGFFQFGMIDGPMTTDSERYVMRADEGSWPHQDGGNGYSHIRDTLLIDDTGDPPIGDTVLLPTQVSLSVMQRHVEMAQPLNQQRKKEVQECSREIKELRQQPTTLSSLRRVYGLFESMRGRYFPIYDGVVDRLAASEEAFFHDWSKNKAIFFSNIGTMHFAQKGSGGGLSFNLLEKPHSTIANDMLE